MLFMLVVGFPEGENSGGVMRHLPKGPRRWRKLKAGAIYSLHNLDDPVLATDFSIHPVPQSFKGLFSLELQNSAF